MIFFDRLELSIADALKKFESLSEVEWNYKPGSGKWSKKEIPVHLTDSFHTNTPGFAYEQNQAIVYKENEWVAYQQYRVASVKDLIELRQLMNRQLARTINQIPADKPQRTSITGEPHTLEWLIEDYIRHMNHHLQQITAA